MELTIAATGTHLLSEFGNTITEIRKTFPALKIDEITTFNLKKSNTEQMATTLLAFEKYFTKTTPDMIIVLGDRFEIFAVAASAYALRIPIAHLHGGETSAGALDEAYRHAITKMSYLHFCSCELHKNRIIAMGEEPERVFNVGALGIENIKKLILPKSDAILKKLGIPTDKPYVLVTFHPVTLEDNTATEQIKELFAFFDSLENHSIIITKSNADAGGLEVNNAIDEYTKTNKDCYAFASLGIKNYLALMKDCVAVIGNSSSGIIEAPAFRVPTINIGDRQKGRLTSDSVVHCQCAIENIKEAYNKIKTNESKTMLRTMPSPYGDGNTSGKIADIIKEVLLNNKIDLKKTFFD